MEGKFVCFAYLTWSSTGQVDRLFWLKENLFWLLAQLVNVRFMRMRIIK